MFKSYAAYYTIKFTLLLLRCRMAIGATAGLCIQKRSEGICYIQRYPVQITDSVACKLLGWPIGWQDEAADLYSQGPTYRISRLLPLQVAQTKRASLLLALSARQGDLSALRDLRMSAEIERLLVVTEASPYPRPSRCSCKLQPSIGYPLFRDQLLECFPKTETKCALCGS